jgi:hypothetical protein
VRTTPVNVFISLVGFVDWVGGRLVVIGGFWLLREYFWTGPGKLALIM